jgi:hypothetical protein
MNKAPHQSGIAGIAATTPLHLKDQMNIRGREKASEKYGLGVQMNHLK